MTTDKDTNALSTDRTVADDIHAPTAFHGNKVGDRLRLETLLAQDPNLRVHDTLEQQLRELYSIQHPKRNFCPEGFETWLSEKLGDGSIEEYGTWFHYSWSGTLVRTLEKEDFITVRTARNKYKITQKEQELLAGRSIGVIGLSVGKSVAMVLAMERGCGTLRLADFDTLELHNLNRIRTGIRDIGLKKTVSVAREISEIDPYLKVVCFHQGITEENIDGFLTGDGKLDLLIEECDSVAIKILARTRAREHGIPVLMEASDRTTIDVERFDLEPHRPLLHGMVQGLNYEKLKGIRDREQAALALLPIVDLPNASKRLKASALEVGESIATWPQLASSVDTGAGICATICRRILLGEFHASGRYQIDVEAMFSDDDSNGVKKTKKVQDQRIPLDRSRQESIIGQLPRAEAVSEIGGGAIEAIVSEAVLAPSGGNSQPWKWYAADGALHVFIDHTCTSPFTDYADIGSYASIGAAIENAEMKARSLGHAVLTELFPLGERSPLVARILFPKGVATREGTFDHLFRHNADRRTDRGLHNGKDIDPKTLGAFTDIVPQNAGARLDIVGDPEKIARLSSIIGETEKLRLMHPQGNHEFFQKELKWTLEEYQREGAGIYIETLNFPEVLKAGMVLASDPQVTALLDKWGKGDRFADSWAFSSIGIPYLGMLSMPSNTRTDYVKGGRWMQRIWLKATQLGLAFQPVNSPISFFARLQKSPESLVEQGYLQKVEDLRKRFDRLMPLDQQRSNILLFKLYRSDIQNPPKLRKPIGKILHFKDLDS